MILLANIGPAHTLLRNVVVELLNNRIITVPRVTRTGIFLAILRAFMLLFLHMGAFLLRFSHYGGPFSAYGGLFWARLPPYENFCGAHVYALASFWRSCSTSELVNYIFLWVPTHIGLSYTSNYRYTNVNLVPTI